MGFKKDDCSVGLARDNYDASRIVACGVGCLGDYYSASFIENGCNAKIVMNFYFVILAQKSCFAFIIEMQFLARCRYS